MAGNLPARFHPAARSRAAAADIPAFPGARHRLEPVVPAAAAVGPQPQLPSGKSASSTTTSSRSQLEPVVPHHRRTASPLRSCRSAAGQPTRPTLVLRPRQARPQRAFLAPSRPPALRQAPASKKPALWRVRAYLLPGFAQTHNETRVLHLRRGRTRPDARAGRAAAAGLPLPLGLLLGLRGLLRLFGFSGLAPFSAPFSALSPVRRLLAPFSALSPWRRFAFARPLFLLLLEDLRFGHPGLGGGASAAFPPPRSPAPPRRSRRCPCRRGSRPRAAAVISPM